MNAFHVDGYLIVINPFHSSSCSTPIEEEQTQPMLPLVFLFFSIFFLCFLSISLYKKLKKQEKTLDEPNTHDPKFSISSTINKFHQTHQNNKPHSLFFEILNSNSPTKLGSLLASISSHLPVGDNGEVSVGRLIDGSELDKDGGSDLVGEDCGKSEKKKKKKGKKKRPNLQAEDGGEETGIDSGVSVLQHKHCLDSLYPFTSSSSATQRKIKQQYDQLVKSNASKGLTMAQVGKFVNCLVEARNDLQHKSETIQRKFTITKALLLKADRSSLDRLSQQLYKLEAEQKRLEEDASVYNRLQQQLKLSPAYKKMLEIGARMEVKASSGQLVENTDTDFPDISFEELLAREKKDTFWQKNGKLRSCMK